jgi:hypothetical protein
LCRGRTDSNGTLCHIPNCASVHAACQWSRRRGFPAARSRVVIRLVQGTKAKPNANTRTLRPDLDSQSSYLNPKLKGWWPLAPARCSAL